MHSKAHTPNAFDKYVHDYWEYYLELENDFLDTRKYVAFEKENFEAFSLEYLKLFQAVCGEIDVLGKAMALAVEPTLKKDKLKSIQHWWFRVQDNYRIYESPLDASNKQFEAGIPLCERCEICLGRFDVMPWKGYRAEDCRNKNGAHYFRLAAGFATPDWWTAHNKVKHERAFVSMSTGESVNYAKANLGNVIEAFAALYILEVAYMQSIGTLEDLEAFTGCSRLFCQGTNDHLK